MTEDIVPWLSQPLPESPYPEPELHSRQAHTPTPPPYILALSGVTVTLSIKNLSSRRGERILVPLYSQAQPRKRHSVYANGNEKAAATLI